MEARACGPEGLNVKKSAVPIAWSRKNAWDRLPGPIRRIAGVGVRLLPRELLLGRHFRQRLAFVKVAQHWPMDRTAAYQLAELQRICAIAYGETEFYRDRFSAAGFHPSELRGLDDLRRIPLLDRVTVRDHVVRMRVRSLPRRTIDQVSTGGTSGVPIHFYIGSSRSAIEFAYLVLGWQRVGYRVGDTLAVFRSRVVPPDSSGLRHDYDPLLNSHYYSNFHMSDADIAGYVAHLRTLGPCFLHVYPSAIAALAHFFRRTGISPPENIRGVLAESEIVYPDQRELVERTFGCRYFSSYGLSEKVVAAAECEAAKVYHVWGTYGYFELLDHTGRPVTTPGARGEIVGTSFINDVMPFIRYRTGDEATYVGNRCDGCGREQLLVSDIRGHRIHESLVAADGSAIQWTAVNMHDDTFARVLWFQFYQETPGRAILRILPAPGFSERDRERIQNNLRQKCEGRLDIAILLVGHIEPSPAGKFMYVEQRLNDTTRSRD